MEKFKQLTLFLLYMGMGREKQSCSNAMAATQIDVRVAQMFAGLPRENEKKTTLTNSIY